MKIAPESQKNGPLRSPAAGTAYKGPTPTISPTAVSVPTGSKIKITSPMNPFGKSGTK